MDIGTAKATPSERAEVPHHMLDVAEPWENYSVARYVSDAKDAVLDIASRGKLPVIAGGTGLYVDSLLSGREFSESTGIPDSRRFQRKQRHSSMAGGIQEIQDEERRPFFYRSDAQTCR